MMIHFTDDDYAAIAEQLQEQQDNYTIEYELDNGLSVEIEGYVAWDSYQETDYVCGYGNGTGAWVNCGLELTATVESVFDEDGNDLPVDCTDFNESELYDALADTLDISDLRYAPARIKRAYKMLDL